MNDKEIILRFKAIEKRLDIIEGKTTKSSNPKKESNGWYKKGSTIHKILVLIEEEFLNNPKTFSEIIKELKSKDYHLKASDLTLPLRKIVRKGILKKTKTRKDGPESKNWMYVKK